MRKFKVLYIAALVALAGCVTTAARDPKACLANLVATWEIDIATTQPSLWGFNTHRRVMISEGSGSGGLQVSWQGRPVTHTILGSGCDLQIRFRDPGRIENEVILDYSGRNLMTGSYRSGGYTGYNTITAYRN